jgi:Zn-dependent protease
MTPTRKGSFHLFRLFGVDVHLHWSWFLVAFYSISIRVPNYENFIWAVGEYLALFLVVLLNEFGHSLACRQVGGTSDQIVLWPLGGVAYVAPPGRPGATLWSIAAGPLVNVALLPVFWVMFYLARASGSLAQSHDLITFLRAILVMDISLLVFNLLPVYPLDGGQILRSLLWFPLGKARSLLAATVIGLIGGVGVVGVAIWLPSVWMGFIA